MFTHVPEDGKTPVFDDASNTWAYVRNPTSGQLTTSVSQFKIIGDRSVNAEMKADTAKQLADTKVTAEEAVSEVKTQMFEVFDSDGTQLEADSFKIQQGENGWTLMFCAHKALVSPGSSPAPFCLSLAYASASELNDLAARVAAIERKLGIS